VNGNDHHVDVRNKSRSRAVRGLFIALGVVCVGLSAVGAVLPVLPTTPFLLAAAFFFARSSDRLNDWLRATKLYKSHLETFERGEGMTRGAKLRIMATVTAVMALAAFFMMRAYLYKGSRGALYGCITMAVVWVCHIAAFCFIIKTCPRERAEQIARENRKKGGGCL